MAKISIPTGEQAFRWHSTESPMSAVHLELEHSLDIGVLAAEEDLRKSTITPHEDKAMASTA